MRKAGLFLVLVFIISTAAALPFLGPVSDMVKVKQVEDRNTNRTAELVEDGSLTLPSGIILLIVASLAIAVYSLDFDPAWLVAAVTLAVFSGAIYHLKLPVYYIPVALTITLAGIYIRKR